MFDKMAGIILPSNVTEPILRHYILRSMALCHATGSAGMCLPEDREHLLQQFNTPRRPAPKPYLYRITVDTPYPSCTCSIDQLESVVLSTLVMASHHRGKVVFVKMIGIPDVGRTAVSAGIEGTNGDIGSLFIKFAATSPWPNGELPAVGQWLATKEPHLTLNEGVLGEIGYGTCVRLDHPLDLLVLQNLPRSTLDSFRLSDSMTSHGFRSAEQFTEGGNSALRVRNLFQAHDCYTEGLQTSVGQSGSLLEDTRSSSQSSSRPAVVEPLRGRSRRRKGVSHPPAG